MRIDLEKPVTAFGSGIFNLGGGGTSTGNSLSFSQSTPIQRPVADKVVAAVAAPVIQPSPVGKPPAAIVSKPAAVAVSEGGETATTRQKLCEAFNEVYRSFESDLGNLRESVRDCEQLELAVGQPEDKVYLKTTTEALGKFAKDLVDTTAGQSLEIGDLRAEAIETFGWVEEATTRSLQTGGRNFVQLARARPLDPRSRKKMADINALYNYLELQLDEANTRLDTEWEESKRLRGGRKSAAAAADSLESGPGCFAAVLTNHRIVEEQRSRLDRLVHEVQRMRLVAGSPATPVSDRPRTAEQSSAEVKSLSKCCICRFFNFENENFILVSGYRYLLFGGSNCATATNQNFKEYFVVSLNRWADY